MTDMIDDLAISINEFDSTVFVLNTTKKDSIKKYKKTIMTKIVKFYIDNNVDYNFLIEKAQVSVKDLALISSGYDSRDDKNALKKVLDVIDKKNSFAQAENSVNTLTSFMKKNSTKEQTSKVWINQVSDLQIKEKRNLVA